MVSALLLIISTTCGSDKSLIPEGDSPDLPRKSAGSAHINLLTKIPYSSARIAVLGDSRDGKTSFEDIVEDIRGMKPRPELVVHLGDMISDPGSGLQWYQFHQETKALAQDFAFYPVVGNHDVDDHSSEETYKKQFPAPANQLYYEVEFKDLLLIFLDSELDSDENEISGAQYDWLERLLAQKGDRFRYRIAFIHRPLFPTANHIGGSLDAHPQERDRLHRLFADRGVNPVFVAHEHIYNRKQVGRVTYVTSGGAGAPQSGGADAFYQFVFVAETDTGLQGYCFSIDGKLKDRFLIK